MTVINVKIRRLHPDAQIPAYATEGAAAFDLVAVEDTIIAPGETKKVPLGFAVELPAGYEMLIRPRSGISLNTKLRVANSPGTIDSDYRSEVAVIIDNIAHEEHGSTPRLRNLAGKTEYYDGSHYPKFTYIIRRGDRIAQGVVTPVNKVLFVISEVLGDTERGESGFGSTGFK